jgi:PIN domain nuclease of toxin-antitoxin system
LILLDTQLLLWAAEGGERLSGKARAVLEAPPGPLFYSPVSVWEVAIKNALGKSGFDVDPFDLAKSLDRAGYFELAVFTKHAVAVGRLPAIHADPFDRLLVAQARAEGMPLLTADRTLARYGDPVRLV